MEPLCVARFPGRQKVGPGNKVEHTLADKNTVEQSPPAPLTISPCTHGSLVINTLASPRGTPEAQQSHTLRHTAPKAAVSPLINHGSVIVMYNTGTRAARPRPVVVAVGLEPEPSLDNPFIFIPIGGGVLLSARGKNPVGHFLATPAN